MKINRISEATGSGNAGTFKVPIVLAPQDWKDKQLAPFNTPVYHYTNAELAYEESDGDFKETPEQRKKIEDKTELLSRIDTYLKNFYTGQTFTPRKCIFIALLYVLRPSKLKHSILVNF